MNKNEDDIRQLVVIIIHTMDVAYKELLEYSLLMRDDLTDCRPADRNSHTLKYLGRMQELAANCRNCGVPDIPSFIRQHLDGLHDIYDILMGPACKILIKDSDARKRLRQFADIFFKGLLKIKNIENFFKRVPSQLFTEFCKGITYFMNETIQQLDELVYHRNASCGSSNHTYLQKFEKVSTDSDEQQNEKQKSLLKCYIERTIYNEIYKKLRYQDIGHLLELKRIERLYQDYNVGQSLNLSIQGAFYPTSVTITYSKEYPKMKLIVSEIYDRQRTLSSPSELYENDIRCVKNVIKFNAKDRIIKHYAKTQTFNAETAWQRV